MNQKLDGSQSSPSVDELEEYIQEVYQEFVKVISKSPDDYCVESGGIEIREEMGDQISVSYRRSFYIDGDGNNAIY